ncbi:hypothetical protein ABZV67_44445, partial [Streptomyces sp. NPDC005065]|uniref:hypothetical protein n=1 Tax=unclassified Streptomyces TaxID=2593676 RepID=UPI0033BA1089
ADTTCPPTTTDRNQLTKRPTDHLQSTSVDRGLAHGARKPPLIPPMTDASNVANQLAISTPLIMLIPNFSESTEDH